MKSACAVLAWSILVVLVAAGMTGSVPPAPANIRAASSTTQVTLASMLGAAAAPGRAAGPAARYVVQPGDTLSGIAARFAVRGGWPALYAANRPLIGPDPDLIRPGAALVLPGQRAPARYRVMPGDTLAAIAAALAVRGGWPALYAANRAVIGPDPDLIRPGTMLTVPQPVASPAVSGPAPRRYPAPPSSAPAGSGHGSLPGTAGAPGGTGVPSWLETLLAAGLLTGAVVLAGPVLLARRRRQQAAARAARPGEAGAGPGPGAGRPGAGKAPIVVADHDRLVVTCSQPDDTVCVLRPPGADPREILRVARLVLPEAPYGELAGQLGMPASWPIVVADHDRLVVTCSQPDGTVYVLRPPGADPREVLRVARLVLPEATYGELAGQLDMPASWPMECRVPAKSACVGLAWSVLTIILVVAAGMGPVRLAQANTRTASSTTQVTLASTPGAAAAPGRAAGPAARYVVQPGDTLSGIAARFAVRGGWPALYAANRPHIGPDPDVIRPGTVLVLPGRTAPARYTVVPGDTLAAIAAALAVRGGWPALYAANRHVIGPDPGLIRPGIVLTVPRPAVPSPTAPGPAGRPAPPPSAPAGSGHGPLPGRTGAPTAGMPQWLKTVLLAAGLLTGAAFLGGPVLLARRRQAAGRAARPGTAGGGRGRGGGGRSRGVAGAVRPVAAAARVHPAGVAVPGVVLATGIVLFTFVESATMRVVPPPGGSGPGSVSAARPGTGQPHYRLQPRQPGPRQPALPGTPGHNARSLACGLEQMAAPLPGRPEISPAGPGRVPRASRNPSSRLPVAVLACDVTWVPSSAATAAARSGGADQ